MGVHGRDKSEHSRSPRTTAGSAVAAAAAAAGGAIVPSSVINVDFPDGASAAGARVQPAAPTSHEQMQVVLDEIMAKNIEKHAEQLFESMQAPILGLVSGITKESLTVVASKVESLDAHVTGLAGKVEAVVEGQVKLAETVDRMAAQIQELSIQKAQPMSQSSNEGQSNRGSNPSPTVFDVSGFSRVPDPTILFCNVEGGVKVSRTKFHDSILKLALEANLDAESFDLVGEPLDDRFEITFKGFDANNIKAKTRQFFTSLSLGRGNYKEQVVLDDQGRKVVFFVNPDKNAAQVRREIYTKYLKEIVQQHVEGKVVYAKKPTGTLFLDRRVLCVLHIVSEEEHNIVWMHDRRIMYKLDEAAVAESLKARIAARGGQYS
jgi:hypothetical protein